MCKVKGTKGLPMDGYGYSYIVNDDGLTIRSPKYQQYMPKIKLDIEKVVFNDPATIVILKDGRKAVVKCGDGDTYDPEKGMAMAICKLLLGGGLSKGNYYKYFKQWLPEEYL